MPIPSKKKDEDSKEYVARCMSNPVMKKDYKDTQQRVAICLQESRASAMEGADLAYNLADAQWDDQWDEFTYETTIAGGVFYEDDREKSLQEQDKKVTLNKPFRTPDGPKKFSVYVKNDKGNVVKVNFGDPNMRIKDNIPGRRKNFRARHNCDNPGSKTKARYWSCRQWSNSKSDI